MAEISTATSNPLQQYLTADIFHTVNKGDNFTSISRKYGVNPDQLIKANPNINNPENLSPGEQIFIPESYQSENLLVADNDQNTLSNNLQSKSTSTTDVTQGKSRKECILSSSNCLFIVNKNPKASSEAPFYEIDGFSQVKQHEQTIEQTAKEAGVDPDLVKAIIHMETTHGYYDIPLSLIDANKSILPMNINTEYWGSSFGTREQLNVPSTNIKEGTRLIKSIQNNLPDNASIAEIATVYNNLNANQISDYGARVEAIYNSKAWEE